MLGVVESFVGIREELVGRGGRSGQGDEAAVL